MIKEKLHRCNSGVRKKGYPAPAGFGSIIKKDIREEEIYSAIKQAKNNAASLFEYTIVEKEERRGVRVGMKSIILKVKGFPFEIYVGDNVNEIVELNIKNK